MKNHVIDNSLKNLGKTVLWQYDRAVRLLAVLKHIQVMYHCAVEQFWDFWNARILSVDTMGDMGCAVWGIFLGVPRPTIKDDDGSERLVATSVYRRILKGTFYLMKASSTFEEMLGYLEIVFGIEGKSSLSKWSIYVSEHGWTTNVEELNDAYIPGIAYYAGEVVWHHEGEDDLGENWKFVRNVTAQENVSWESVSSAVERTNEQTTRRGGGDTLLLKLYDPEGICRKIGGAPADSLSISVEYEFGDTTIRAEATRKRKCGLTLVDNGDMSMTYGKSPYYEEMHPDQRAIFEQRMDDFCPFPLGIKTNEPVPETIFGFVGQDNEKYASNKNYAVGDIFSHIDENGVARNYKCIKAIGASVNTSFKAIEDRVEETFEGDPNVCGLVDCVPPYNYITAGCNQPRYNGGLAYLASLLGIDDETIIPYINVLPGLCIGRIGGIDYMFVSPQPEEEFAVSDGETYAACAVKNSRLLPGMSGMSTIYVTTKELIERMPEFAIPRTASPTSEVFRDSLFARKFGLPEAIGEVASKLGWKRIEATRGLLPVVGIQYPTNAAFSVEG